jgi:hypothetical protein
MVAAQAMVHSPAMVVERPTYAKEAQRFPIASSLRAEAAVEVPARAPWRTVEPVGDWSAVTAPRATSNLSMGEGQEAHRPAEGQAVSVPAA